MAAFLQGAIALSQASPERISIIFPDFIPQFKVDRVLGGVVEINQPDLDPNRGLIQLPETVVDPNALVAQNPCKRGSDSEFVNTG